MHIAIIGAGKVGSALARGWHKKGHVIHFGLRNPGGEKYAAIAQETGATLSECAQAVKESQIVVIAVPWAEIPAAVESCGDLAGRIVVDTTNPVRRGASGIELEIGFSSSGAEEIARMVPQAKVFKTMNQVGFEIMDDAAGYAPPPAMFVAGDDEAAKRVVIALVADLGFSAEDIGPLSRARLLEPYALLWILRMRSEASSDLRAFSLVPKRAP